MRPPLTSPYHIASFSDHPYIEVRGVAALQKRIIDRFIARDDLEQALESQAIDREITSVARRMVAGAWSSSELESMKGAS